MDTMRQTLSEKRAHDLSQAAVQPDGTRSLLSSFSLTVVKELQHSTEG